MSSYNNAYKNAAFTNTEYMMQISRGISNIPPGNIDNQILEAEFKKNNVKEEINEYGVIMKSINRDINTYKNPFLYKVDICPPPQNISENIYDEHNKFLYTENKLLKSKNAIIDETMNNIKYIILESVILPKSANFQNDDIINKLDNDMFTIIKIKDHTNKHLSSYTYSTENKINDSFEILQCKDKINDYYNKYIPATKIRYTFKNKINLKSLQISFHDSNGDILNSKISEKNIEANNKNIQNVIFLKIGKVESICE